MFILIFIFHFTFTTIANINTKYETIFRTLVCINHICINHILSLGNHILPSCEHFCIIEGIDSSGSSLCERYSEYYFGHFFVDTYGSFT